MQLYSCTLTNIHFDKIKNYTDWVENVPIRDYEALKNYIGELIEGKENMTLLKYIKNMMMIWACNLKK